MILRPSPSGSSAIRHSLSQIIVLLVSGPVDAHFKPSILGFPVVANAGRSRTRFTNHAGLLLRRRSNITRKLFRQCVLSFYVEFPVAPGAPEFVCPIREIRAVRDHFLDVLPELSNIWE
jgi:hypothetical protein